MKELIPYIGANIDDVLQSLQHFLPEFVLAALFLLLVITDVFFGKRYRNVLPIIAAIGMLLAVLTSALQFNLPTQNIFGNMLMLTHIAVLFKILFGVGMLFLIAFSVKDFRIRNNPKGWGDYFSLFAAAHLGLNLMVMADNLLMVFISIELVSICSYVLTTYISRDKVAAEGGLKYILFGAMSSAVMLYGFSLLYGFTGTLHFDANFVHQLSLASPLGVGMAIILSLAGFAFKISMFPMHFWTPDVYESTSNPIVAFLISLPKAAGIAILMNFMAATFIDESGEQLFQWQVWIPVLAIISMTIGNFQAIWQDNIKRMLAYSSIGHSGFILMGLAAYTYLGEASVLYYLVVYTFANIAALMIVALFSYVLHSENISDYKGLGFKMPVTATCMVVILMSLVGIPPVGGFVAKFFVFSAAYEAYVQQGNNWFVFMLIAGAINTVVALFYYLKIPLNMFFRKSNNVIVIGRTNKLLTICMVILTLLTVLLGIMPGWIIDLLPS